MVLSPRDWFQRIFVNSTDGLDLIVEVPKVSFIDFKFKMQSMINSC